MHLRSNIEKVFFADEFMKMGTHEKQGMEMSCVYLTFTS